MDEPAENPEVIRQETVKRPMNAFLIFCKRHRGLVHEKNPSLDNRSVTRILGDLWANLGQQEKYMYTDLAKQVWGHPFMTSTKNSVFGLPSPCPHESTWAGLPPSPLWTSTRGRQEIHTAL